MLIDSHLTSENQIMLSLDIWIFLNKIDANALMDKNNFMGYRYLNDRYRL